MAPIRSLRYHNRYLAPPLAPLHDSGKTRLAATTASAPPILQDPLARYARQTILPAIGREGQERLTATHVLVVGCGALGSTAANLLARAGVGRLTIVDRDYVELHNLQRQTLFDEADVAAHLPKSVAAATKLRRINTGITVAPLVADINAASLPAMLPGVDLIVDGLDNFETRYLVNDAAVKHGIPWVYGGVIGTYGMTMTVRPGRSACLRCVFPEPPAAGTAPTCDTAGVLGPAVDIIAGLQAAEALKLAVGATDALNPGLLAIDVWSLTFDRIPLPGPVPTCSTCGERRFTFLDRADPSQTTALCGHDAVQVLAHPAAPLDLAALAARLAPTGETLSNRFLLRFRPHESTHELTIFPDSRAIIKGTTDPTEAKVLYARYIGN